MRRDGDGEPPPQEHPLADMLLIERIVTPVTVVVGVDSLDAGLDD
jgi:hypothetical protein